MVLSQKLSVYKTLSFLCNLDIEKYTIDWRVSVSFSQCVNLCSDDRFMGLPHAMKDDLLLMLGTLAKGRLLALNLLRYSKRGLWENI